jgi:methionyl-tRNA formyltransferase
LLAAGHDVPLVLTRPDRPAGRGLRPAASAVRKLADERGLAVFQPDTFKDERALDRLAAARTDAFVVAAYGLILPKVALEISPHGAINIHASLLPRWRGAAPIQRALLAGDCETGISIMKMDAGLDTGPLLSLHRLAIAGDDDAQTLHDRLAALGAQAIVAALDDIAAGRAQPAAQAEAGATYARKIETAEADLDWSRPCIELERAVRALRPSPGARSRLGAAAIKIWRAHCIAREGTSGAVLEADAEGIVIACGEGALQATELQRPGGTRLAAAEFLRGFPIGRGDRFGAAR